MLPSRVAGNTSSNISTQVNVFCYISLLCNNNNIPNAKEIIAPIIDRSCSCKRNGTYGLLYILSKQSARESFPCLHSLLWWYSCCSCGCWLFHINRYAIHKQQHHHLFLPKLGYNCHPIIISECHAIRLVISWAGGITAWPGIAAQYSSEVCPSRSFGPCLFSVRINFSF